MRDERTLAVHLAAWAKDEVAAQQQLLAALERQEEAVRVRDHGAIESAGEELERLSGTGATRARRRDFLLGQLAELWQVPRSVLTLGSVIERLGPKGELLVDLRAELRDGAALVLKKSRRVAALVNAFRRLSNEVVELLLTDEEGTPLHQGGTLIHVEA